MEIIGLIILWIGVGFCAAGILGMIRMPDVYCRLHASGKVATVGLCGLLLGAVFIMPAIALKGLALAIFAVLTLPVSTHAIAAAAYRHGVPVTGKVLARPQSSPSTETVAEEETYAVP
jgi:multicomponent Na+:H+ antiporter subunit G